MKVWIVTEEAFSQEGLEGAFDVFVGVAATALDALALVEHEAGVQRNEHQFVIGKGNGSTYNAAGLDYDNDCAITLETKQYRYKWVDRKQVRVEDGGYWSHCTTWHVREVEVAGFDRDAMLEAVKQHDYATGRRVEFDTDHVHAVSNRDEGVVTP